LAGTILVHAAAARNIRTATGWDRRNWILVRQLADTISDLNFRI